MSTCDVVESIPLLEQCVVAVFGARVLAVWERFKWDAERKTDDEREALRRMCEACPVGSAHGGQGCSGGGVVVVWGSGSVLSFSLSDSPR